MYLQLFYLIASQLYTITEYETLHTMTQIISDSKTILTFSQMKFASSSICTPISRNSPLYLHNKKDDTIKNM